MASCQTLFHRRRKYTGRGNETILPIQVLAVEDIAAQPRTGTASVLVYVDNENDNSPVFLPSDSYTVSVLEEQPPVSVLQVCVCVCALCTYEI